MSINIIKGIAAFVVLLLVQALVLNNIHLFNCATPMLYVYIVLLFPRNFPRWASLVSSFTMGLCVDIFSNTPGVAAASMTLIGFLQPYVLMLFLPRESAEDLIPSMKSLGYGKFIGFTLILVAVYCLVFFALEAFNFDNGIHWLECVGGSFALTSILLFTIDHFRSHA